MSGVSTRDPTGDLLARLRDGRLGCRELMEATLATVEAEESRLRAWVRLIDRDALLAEAEAMDLVSPAERGLLHGLPLGVKDTIDTRDLPTELGGVPWRGRQPASDAACVMRARAAGAVIQGKTVTTEYALRAPSVTRHPRDVTRSPGGSSSGSAAAVATGMTPLALGSQTNGSMLRPASYCGVYGFKPSFGLLPLEGVAPIAPTVDTLGVFSRDVSGLAAATAALARTPAAGAHGGVDLIRQVHALEGRQWRVGLVRAGWSRVEPWVGAAVDEFVDGLGARYLICQIPWPAELEAVFDEHMVIQDAGVAAYLGELGPGQIAGLSPGLQENIKRGRAISGTQLTRALAVQERVRSWVEERFDEVDILVTAAATGEAPGLESTGDPVMNTIWTDAGTPAVSVPVLEGPTGFPLGLQVISRRGRDADALAFAAAISNEIIRIPGTMH